MHNFEVTYFGNMSERGSALDIVMLHAFVPDRLMLHIVAKSLRKLWFLQTFCVIIIINMSASQASPHMKANRMLCRHGLCMSACRGFHSKLTEVYFDA